MKPIKYFIHILISLLYTQAFSQSAKECFNIAERLFHEQKYEQAISLYNRVAFFDVNMKAHCYYRIAVSNFYLANYFQSEDYFNYAYQNSNDDSLTTAIFYDKVMLYIYSRKYELAQAELLSVNENQKNKTFYKYNLFQGIATLGKGDYESSIEWLGKILNREEIAYLKELISTAKKWDKRKPKRAFLMSLVIPGSGQLRYRYKKEALNSFVLTGILATLTVIVSLEYNLLNALFIVVPWFKRYYLGGAFKAEALANERKLDNHKQLVNDAVNLILKSGKEER